MPATPSKRRKKNDFQSSDKPVRSLDHFFGKKPESVSATRDAQELTDEQLARKLQAEWDEQDKAPAEERILSQQSADHDRESRHSAVDIPTDPVSAIIEAQTTVGEKQGSKSPSAPAVTGLAPKNNTLSLQSATAAEDTISYTIPFDQSPLTFDPIHYTPQLQQLWESEKGATYALLTHCFTLINSTQSRIKIVDTLVNLLRVLILADPQSLLPAVWLATNSISPPYIDLELGLGGSSISKALKKVCGLDNTGLKTLYNKYGDAGDVAFEAKKRQSLTLRKPKPLTIKSVYECLVKIANAKGNGSQEVKQRIVERLVQDARGAEESRYIVRTLVQHLRIGAVKTTMLIALSRAFLLTRSPESDSPIRLAADLAKLSKQDLAEVYSRPEELVKACFARRPNYNDLVPTMLEIGVTDELLFRCGLAMHIPLRPMLGGITRDLNEMLTKLQGRDFSCEYKYDGQRAQVHCDAQGKVTIFSRHLELMTDKYPDLVALVPKIRGDGVTSFIIEGEVVAVDRETGDLKPFQILANRARKDVVIQSVKVDVCLYAFDLMYLNGEELLDRPFRERRSLLKSLFIEQPGHFTWVASLDATSADSETVSTFFKSALGIKCEGIMVKVLDNLPNPDLQQDLDDDDPEKVLQPRPVTTPSKKTAIGKATSGDVPGEKKGGRRKALLSTYEPDKRLDSWLKVKKDYDTTADTIDLIPIGGWHGQGRKAKWWSPILLAARNPETGCLEAVTKCISGFTDAFYKANKEKYEIGSDNVISRPSYVEYAGTPDVWFEPQEVWEMAFADITLSPTYTAAIGLVSEDRGLSLRFPRFLKVRDDKAIDNASTSDFLASLYRAQEAKAPQEKLEPANDDVDE